jgi:hypothetical protein
MKNCGYCGRENEDNVTICSGCGFELSNKPISLFPQNFFRWKFSEGFGYLAAIPVAFAVSIITGLLYVLFDLICVDLKINVPNLLNFLVGFNGVFFGACCFPRGNRRFRNRVFGSMLLLLAGLGFEIYLRIQTFPHSHTISSLALIETGIGGIIGMALHYRRKSRRP